MSAQNEQTERLINAIENLNVTIDNAKKYQYKDYSTVFADIIISLKEIGNGYTNNGCLNKIHDELRLLNKNIIMAALLISTPTNPEKNLQTYNKIIDSYLH